MKKQPHHHHFIRLLFLLTGLFLSNTVNAQYSISGTILSKDDRQALAGANLRLTQSKVKTQTDQNGSFQLNASTLPDTLVVSYTGATESRLILNIGNYQQHHQIFLASPSNNLQEVVISTGYQQIPKERATGAFSTVSNKLFNQQVSTRILDRLEASASGIAIDRATGTSAGRLMIRGLSTLGGPRSPLIILDNNPYEGDLSNLNPNDVENITILKDAAAASIWGARAGNGVIVITTKKGKYEQPLSAEFNSSLSIGSKPDLSYIPQMSTSDFIDVEKQLFSKGYYQSLINSSTKPALSPVVELLIKRNTANPADQAAIDQQIEQLRNYDIRDEFNRYFYQNSLNQQYALSFKGGTEKYAWLLSAGHDHNSSNLNERYRRLNLRANQSLKLSRNLSLSGNLQLTRSNSVTGKPGFGQITSLGNATFPYARFADENGNPIAATKDYRLAYLQGLNNPGLADWNYYPLTDYQHNQTSNQLQDLLTNAALDYRLIPELKLSLQYQFEQQDIDGKTLMDQESYAARNLYNLYSSLNPDGTLSNKIPRGGVLDLSTTGIQAHQWRGQLNFDKDWDCHQFNFLAGAETRETATRGNTYRTYGYNPDNLSFGSVDFSKTYPTWINGSNSFIPDNRSFTDQMLRFVSVYANGAYTYQEKYTLSGSIRRDASNLFGVSTINKWKPLWSAGLAWNIAKEWFVGSKTVNELKLRATYGFSGNTDPARVAVTTLFNQGTSPYTNTPFYSFNQFANPQLKWETVRQINTGIDFAFFNSRLSGSLDGYLKTASDLFGVVPVDYTAGVGFQIQRNVAKIQGKGLDLVLNSQNTSGMIQWSTDLNFSYHKDVVKEYYHADFRAANFMNQGNPRVSAIPGQTIYGIYAYPWAGLEPSTGMPQGYLNGAISKDYLALTGTDIKISDVNYYGSALPVYYGSLGNTIRYKTFSIEARLLFKLGYYFRRSTIDYGTLYAQWSGHRDFAQRWQQPGDEQRTDIPAQVYPLPNGMSNYYLNAEPFIEKGDHIRLQYITLNYRHALKPGSKLPFQSINFYSSISNLGLIWKANKQGIDPDYAIDYTSLRPPLTIAFGLKANF